MEDKAFRQMIKDLCQPFDENVRKRRHDGHGFYIPADHYILRLNEIAGPNWSHERVGEPVFYEEDQRVYVLIRLMVGDRSHTGEGFSRYNSDNGKIINRHYAIRSATKDAIRNACSFFGMGQQDDLTNNQAPRTHETETKSIYIEDNDERSCLKCGEILTSQDVDELTKYKVKFDYCFQHIPAHFKKKKPSYKN